MNKLRCWAIVGTESGDGIWACIKNGNGYPLVTLSERIVPSMEEVAKKIFAVSGKTYRLVEFHES